MMQPAAYKEFVSEFNRELNRLGASEDQERTRLNKKLGNIDRDLARLIDAIKSGIPGAAVKDEISALELHKTELKNKLEVVPAQQARLHPRLADVYRNKVANLVEALNAPDTVADAAEAIRSLIEAIRLLPEEGELKIEIYGELAALITLGQKNKNKHPGGDTSGVQVTLVAGVGFEPTTFRL
jgi:chromosome segregation ATPase